MSLESVDDVIIFTESNPLELIKVIKPDILVKGGDWKVEDIVGHKFILDRGGDVLSISFRPGYSTTKIIKKIESLNE